jgi:PAS domain S-box-containing protein
VEAHYPLARNGFVEDLYFDATFVPALLETGEIGGSVSTLFDVTSRVSSRTLEAERDRFRMLVQHSSDAHGLFDSDARLLWANHLMSERLGYTLEELQTLTIPDINPEFSLARYRELFERARRERVPPFESVHRRNDGTTFPVEITPTVVELAEGVRLFSSVRDITERKQANAALQESEARFRVLADLSPVAMLVIQDGCYTYANAAAARLLGARDAQEIIGRPGFCRSGRPRERT